MELPVIAALRRLQPAGRVRLQDDWTAVPDDTVITESNQVGGTIVWPHYVDGRPMIRCFTPGSMT